MNRQQILMFGTHTAFVIIVACREEVENDEILFPAREQLSPMGALEYQWVPIDTNSALES